MSEWPTTCERPSIVGLRPKQWRRHRDGEELPDVRLEEKVLVKEVESKLRRRLREQRQQAKLLTHAPPRSNVLPVGRLGTGNTMSIRALAGELRRRS